MIQAVVLALVMAWAFGLAWWVHRQRYLWVWAMAWLAYALYEYLMFARVLCSGECNIRIDLLLFFPPLLLGTIWVALRAALRCGHKAMGRESGL